MHNSAALECTEPMSKCVVVHVESHTPTDLEGSHHILQLAQVDGSPLAHVEVPEDYFQVCIVCVCGWVGVRVLV
jgi:hypothetical protein